MSFSKETKNSGSAGREDADRARLIENAHDREAAFKRENAEAFASMNAWVEQKSLPLEKYRQF